ncbi:MAG: hypothetical protein AAF563_02760 [Pseudomonadota bacterium]
MVLDKMISSSVVLVLFLGGCALSDTGAVDYRTTDLREPWEQDELDERLGSPSRSGDTDIMLPLDLVWRNWSPDSLDREIEAGDSVAIRLQQAYIEDCIEGGFDPTDGWGHNCEIAVIVDVFEFDGSAQHDFDFSAEGKERGRVVYYSEDVVPGQHLNFNNMPIYGPIEYNGGPIGMNIFILELETENAQASALLDTLASIGGMAYAPAQPIFNALNSLGSALLTGSTDDTNFEYAVTFDPDSNGAYPYARLAVGDYIFVREQDRSAETPWDMLTYDQNTGRLFYKTSRYNDDGTLLARAGDPFLESTYISIQINKNLSSVRLDLSQNTYGVLRAKLDEADAAAANRLSEAGQDIIKETATLLTMRRQIVVFDEARSQLNIIRQAQLDPENAALVTAARQAANSLLLTLSSAITATNKLAETENTDQDQVTDAPDLNVTQIKYLLSNLEAIAGVTDLAQMSLFEIKTFPVDDIAKIYNLIEFSNPPGSEPSGEG